MGGDMKGDRVEVAVEVGQGQTFESDSTLTFLLTDIEGSTRNWEASEPDMRRALAQHDALLGRILREHGGRVLTERGEGDSFFALFGPASDAVAAALAVQRALAREPWPKHAPIRVRIAIHTGEAGADHRGPEVNRCARLRGIAHGGQTLLSAPTAALVRGRLPDGATLEDLGLHRLRDLTIPERVFALTHPDLPAVSTPLASLDAFRHNLPLQGTTFIGRAAELASVWGILRGRRLVTLTGAGGTGKTRLALQVAAEHLDEFADGVWFADLAPVTDPSLVPAIIASATGIAEIPGRPLAETLADQLAGRRSLLVIDNCEHVVDAVSTLLHTILRRADGPRVLTTSQEALNVPGELAWRVPSLSLPGVAEVRGAAGIAGFESVQLFVARAVAAQPTFTLRDDNADAVAQICRRLDGVPLAIELAAARVKVLGPDELLHRLEDRFRLLTGGSRTALPRQQTLRAAVDWSHDLLGPAERVLFRRLSVFAGGFDLAAAEGVCGTDPLASADVLDLLAQLVDKSLVIAEPDGLGQIRYLLLESLRQYGRERLEEAAEVDRLADAHLRFYVSLAERAYARRVANEQAGLVELEGELENLRAALDRSRSADPDLELRLAGALGWFWSLHTEHASEGRDRLDHALAGREERSALMGRALCGAAMTATWAGDPAEAARLAERGIVIWRELGDDLELGLAHEALGWARFFEGEVDAALGALRAGVACMERVGDRRLLNRVTVALGQALVALGDVEAIEALAHRTLAIGRELGAPRDVHYSLHYLGDSALYRGDGVVAASWYRQSMAAALAYGNVAEAAVEMEGFAMALAASDRPAECLRLAAAARSREDAFGFDGTGVAFWARFRERYLGGARETVGPSADSIEAEGRAMGWQAALAMVSSLGPLRG